MSTTTTEQLVTTLAVLRSEASVNTDALAFLNRLHREAAEYGVIAGGGFEEAGRFVLTGVLQALAEAEDARRGEVSA